MIGEVECATARCLEPPGDLEVKLPALRLGDLGRGALFTFAHIASAALVVAGPAGLARGYSHAATTAIWTMKQASPVWF
jgi:hypothetical protein